MLVLTRRAGEEITIGDEVVVKVLKIRGGQVHIGIGAPRDMAVHRREVKDRIEEQEARER